MRTILRTIGIIIELIIAIAIFIILAQKTPLFERIVSKIDNNTNTEQTATLTPDQETDQKKKSTNNTGTTAINNAEPLSVSVYPSGKGCMTPWGESISDNQSITAYANHNGGTDNTCISELRVCKQGKLSGSFKLKSCSIIVEGKRDGQDIIPGASSSEQRLGDGAVKFQQYLKDNRQYIQPNTTIKSKELTYADTQSRPMENKENVVYNDTRSDFLDQEKLRHPHNNQNTGSCTTPRGETVQHGKFVYAYNINNSNIHQTCKLEKRSCRDGKLSGTYTKQSCNSNISQKNRTSDQGQSLARNEHNRLGSLFDPIMDNGILSPGGPKHISLSDLIRYPIKSTRYGTKGIRTGPNPIPIHTGTSSTQNNTQNYIAYASCSTPRGTSVKHGRYITAYRNQHVEWNSLCDSEVRVCRDGKLRGSFQYKSCNTNTKPIKKNNIRYPGKIILDTTETVIDTVEYTSKSVWDWVRDLFR